MNVELKILIVSNPWMYKEFVRGAKFAENSLSKISTFEISVS